MAHDSASALDLTTVLHEVTRFPLTSVQYLEVVLLSVTDQAEFVCISFYIQVFWGEDFKY